MNAALPIGPDALAQVEATAYAVARALPRVAAVFTVLPFLSGQMLTGLVRGGLVLVIAIFVSPLTGAAVEPGVVHWVLVAAKEALIGAMLGLGFGVLIWAVQSMGDLIDLQIGSDNANFFDPVAGHEGGRTGEFLGWLVVTLFVTTGGLLALIGALIDSYRLWPVATFVPRFDVALELFALREGDQLFDWIVKLAGPVLLVLVLAELGIGLVGRVAPQLNVFVFAQPVKALLAVLMLVLLLFYVHESLREFLRPDNSVLQFLRSAM